jgi:hypothetical protein
VRAALRDRLKKTGVAHIYAHEAAKLGNTHRIAWYIDAGGDVVSHIQSAAMYDDSLSLLASAQCNGIWYLAVCPSHALPAVKRNAKLVVTTEHRFQCLVTVVRGLIAAVAQ